MNYGSPPCKPNRNSLFYWYQFFWGKIALMENWGLRRKKGDRKDLGLDGGWEA